MRQFTFRAFYHIFDIIGFYSHQCGIHFIGVNCQSAPIALYKQLFVNYIVVVVVWYIVVVVGFMISFRRVNCEHFIIVVHRVAMYETLVEIVNVGVCDIHFNCPIVYVVSIMRRCDHQFHVR